MVQSVGSPPFHRGENGPSSPDRVELRHPHVRHLAENPQFYTHSPPTFLRQRAHGDVVGDDGPQSNALDHTSIDSETKRQSPLVLSTLADKCPESLLNETSDTPEMKKQSRKMAKARPAWLVYFWPDPSTFFSKKGVEAKTPTMRLRASAFLLFAGILMVLGSFRSIASVGKVCVDTFSCESHPIER